MAKRNRNISFFLYKNLVFTYISLGRNDRMRQIIPFQKEIAFKTMISKITSISLEHTLELKESDIVLGDFIVSGSYKMTEASQIDEDFSYKIPIEIAIDNKYDTNNITLEIDDFVYEVLDEERLLLKIDLCIDGLELKQLESQKEEEVISSYDEDEEFDNVLKEIEDEIENHQELVRNEDEDTNDLFLDASIEEKLEVPINIDDINNSKNDFMKDESITQTNNISNDAKDVTSIFSAFKDTDETFSTYSVYIIREGDSLDSVMNKYKTTRDVLSEYNDLSDVRIGTKIIVPSSVTNE